MHYSLAVLIKPDENELTANDDGKITISTKEQCRLVTTAQTYMYGLLDERERLDGFHGIVVGDTGGFLESGENIIPTAYVLPDGTWRERTHELYPEEDTMLHDFMAALAIAVDTEMGSPEWQETDRLAVIEPETDWTREWRGVLADLPQHLVFLYDCHN